MGAAIHAQQPYATRQVLSWTQLPSSHSQLHEAHGQVQAAAHIAAWRPAAANLATSTTSSACASLSSSSSSSSSRQPGWRQAAVECAVIAVEHGPDVAAVDVLVGRAVGQAEGLEVGLGVFFMFFCVCWCVGFCGFFAALWVCVCACIVGCVFVSLLVVGPVL